MNNERDPLTMATEALARRNFDAECGDTWTFDGLPAEIKRGWLSEALKQAKIVAAHFEPQQVTTVEELEALPIGAVVILRDSKHEPHPAQKGEHGWRLPFVDDFWTSAELLAGSTESAELVDP